MRAIVVLGCQIIKNKCTGIYEASQMLAMRLDKCYEIFCKISDDYTIIIVSGGSPCGESISEAGVMKKYLINKGITKCRIFEENLSNNTLENCQYTYTLLRELYEQGLTLQELHPNYDCNYYGSNKNGEIPMFEELCIITSDFHIPRSKIIFENHNNNALRLIFISAPIPEDTSSKYLENEKYLLSNINY